MRILSHIHAREELGEGWSEEDARLILTISGRTSEWLKKCSDTVKDWKEARGRVRLG